MSFKRCTLHKTHLEPFQYWLREIMQIPYRNGKGPYQVMQVLTEKDGWQVVFSKDEMPEHFSCNEKLMPLVNAFYQYKKTVGL